MQSRDYLSPVLIAILLALLLQWLTPALAAGGADDSGHGQTGRGTDPGMLQITGARHDFNNRPREGSQKK